MASNGHTIDLGHDCPEWAGQTAVVRRHLSYAATQRVEQARMVLSADQSGEMTAVPDPVGYACQLVDAAVLEWTLVGLDGEPLPAGRAGVMSDECPNHLMDRLVERIGEFYAEQAPKGLASS